MSNIGCSIFFVEGKLFDTIQIKFSLFMQHVCILFKELEFILVEKRIPWSPDMFSFFLVMVNKLFSESWNSSQIVSFCPLWVYVPQSQCSLGRRFRGLSSDGCHCFSWMGKEGKKSIILIKTFWFSLKCRPSALTLFMELSAISFCVAGVFFSYKF